MDNRNNPNWEEHKNQDPRQNATGSKEDVNSLKPEDRLKDGTRKITNVTEVQGMEGDVIVLQDIFTFQQTGVENGKIVGRMKPTGIRPKFIHRFEVHNIYLPPNIFGAGIQF